MSCQNLLTMDRVEAMLPAGNDVLCLVDVVWGPVNNQQKLVGLEGGLVFEDTVLWNTDAD